MPPLVECVPNFSEGRDATIIQQIADRLASVESVSVLHVDAGKATNRTVITLAGPPEAVIESAFRGIARAAELIDMRRHTGEHPRMGATDVCPLVPISDISLEEAAEYSKRLAERVGRELGIPVFLYEAAQADPARKNLAAIRAGEYEGLRDKIARPEWRPDFGPAEFNPKSGATVIGARDFLVAFNVNLNTTSTRRANAIAFDVREAGRPKREGHPLTGRPVVDAAGIPVMIPGSLKSVKAIGWFIKEYGIAQVSMNLTDISVTPLHVAFDEVCRRAETRGIRVTGSEIVGLIPLGAMLEAGRYFLRKQERSTGVADAELIRIAVKSLGLEELSPFVPGERIIEYRMPGEANDPLVKLTVEDFTAETASESPAPGGGSVAALVGSLGASLGAMVANLSANKRGWEERWLEFSDWADRGQRLRSELVRLIDEDTRAFNDVMAALALPKATPGEKAARKSAVSAANQNAIRAPFRVMKLAHESFELLEAMATSGNPASASDAGVGALCARAAVRGAWLNVLTNLAGAGDRAAFQELLADGKLIVEDSAKREERILQAVEKQFG
ncbi:MAG: glutamate formimidoyltransferase [Gemmatimonadota bacterium]